MNSHVQKLNQHSEMLEFKKDLAKYICVNDDDDNNNGTPDKDETGTVSGEDDLVAIYLSYLPSYLYPGYVELKIPYDDNDIKVWSSSEKGTLVVPDGSNYYKRWQLGSQPSTLYVEGCSAGSAELWLLYSNSTNPPNRAPYVTVSWSGGGTPSTGSGSQFTTNWSTPGPKTVIATCGSSNAQKNVTIVAVDKLQYWDGISSQWVDIGSTLYIAKDDSVTFKAIPAPSGASWPGGKPVWGGTAGASGTGETKIVTFSTLSSSTSDYKTVTAECNNTVTVNVIVFDFEGVLTPDDDFEYRSLDDYGVEETVSLSHTTNPTGITGLPLEWEIHSGVGYVIVEESKYDAEAVAGAVTLKLQLQSGPSKGHYKSYNKTVHAPTYRFARSRFETGIYHIYRQHGIKFKGEYFVDPTNVSFTNIEIREGTSTPADGEGYFEPKDGYVHPVGNWCTPLYPNTE